MLSGMNEELVSGMAAAFLSISSRISAELDRGKFDIGLIRGDKGILLATSAGPEAALILLADKDARLGLVFLEMKRAAEDIAKIMWRG